MEHDGCLRRGRGHGSILTLRMAISGTCNRECEYTSHCHIPIIIKKLIFRQLLEGVGEELTHMMYTNKDGCLVVIGWIMEH